MARKVLVGAYPAVWLFSVAFFWLFTSGSDAMGYTLLFIWALNPIAIAVVSFLIGRVEDWGVRAWAAPVAFGLLYTLLGYVTFSVANTLAFGNVHIPDLTMALAGAAISAIALLVGRATRKNEEGEGLSREQIRSRLRIAVVVIAAAAVVALAVVLSGVLVD